MKKIKLWVHQFLRYVGRYVLQPWFPLLIAAIALVDAFIFLIPLSGILMSAAIAAPRRWVALGVGAAAGCGLGTWLFAFLFYQGVHLAGAGGPHWAQAWFDHYGVWALFGITTMPIGYHPILIIACLAEMPAAEVGTAIFAGTLIKYCILTYVCTHAPKLLTRFKWLEKLMHQGEKELELPPVDLAGVKSVRSK